MPVGLVTAVFTILRIVGTDGLLFAACCRPGCFWRCKHQASSGSVQLVTGPGFLARSDKPTTLAGALRYILGVVVLITGVVSPARSSSAAVSAIWGCTPCSPPLCFPPAYTDLAASLRFAEEEDPLPGHAPPAPADLINQFLALSVLS